MSNDLITQFGYTLDSTIWFVSPALVLATLVLNVGSIAENWKDGIKLRRAFLNWLMAAISSYAGGVAFFALCMIGGFPGPGQPIFPGAYIFGAIVSSIAAPAWVMFNNPRDQSV